MKILVLGFVVAACMASSAVAPLLAHHSFAAEFDSNKPVKVTGTITKVEFQNPHIYFYIDVKDASGAAQVWALEATNRAGLEKAGVTREYIKPGDAVKARCHPLRDKTNGCLLGFLKARDGSVKDWDGGNAPAPKDF